MMIFKRAVAIMVFLSMGSFMAAVADAEETRVHKSPSGKTMNYLLYVPEGFEASGQTQYPLVLFLHGGGEGGDDIQKVKKHGPPRLIAEGQTFPFILVAPQNPSPTQFWDDQQVMSVLQTVQENMPVDHRRVYLTGLSRGGYGAWRLAIQNPDHFAALVPICGGGPLPYVKRIKHMPTWVFHGAKDPVIPISESERLVNALKAVRGNVKFTVYPEAHHDAWTETYSNPAVFEWMLKQQRTR